MENKFNKDAKYKWAYETKCPFCKKVNFNYVDFIDYKEFTDEDRVEWENFLNIDLDNYFNLTPCEHLAFYTNMSSLMGSEAVIQDKWRKQILKFAKGIHCERIKPIEDSSNLEQFIDDYLDEGYDDSMKSTLKKRLPNHDSEIIYIETNWENGPKADYSADPTYLLIYLRKK